MKAGVPRRAPRASAALTAMMHGFAIDSWGSLYVATWLAECGVVFPVSLDLTDYIVHPAEYSASRKFSLSSGRWRHRARGVGFLAEATRTVYVARGYPWKRGLERRRADLLSNSLKVARGVVFLHL